ncbi:TniQ family protein [Marinomonas gallaica]|uniref:TniQ family protein n=1 Tax=Marinomonas gallaica TaxID=1806667 RepID=UPI003A8F5E5F
MSFIQLYPDEHVYSGILRYWYKSGDMYLTRRHRFKLHGIPHHSFKVKAPMGADINRVIERYTFSEPDEYLLRLNHTTLPLQLLSGDYEELYKHIGSDHGYRYQEPRINSDHRWRFCSKCFEEERQRIGIAYWHTSHQLPSLMYCPEHNVRLHSHDSLSVLDDQLPHHIADLAVPLMEANNWEGPWQAFIVNLYSKMKVNPKWINIALEEIKADSEHWVRPENFGRTKHVHDFRRIIEADTEINFNSLTDFTTKTAREVFDMFWQPEYLLETDYSPSSILLGLYWKRNHLKCMEM